MGWSKSRPHERELARKAVAYLESEEGGSWTRTEIADEVGGSNNTISRLLNQDSLSADKCKALIDLASTLGWQGYNSPKPKARPKPEPETAFPQARSMFDFLREVDHELRKVQVALASRAEESAKLVAPGLTQMAQQIDALRKEWLSDYSKEG